MSKQLTKTQSQRWHTKWAIRDRYGIFCNRDVYFAILDLIKSGKSEMLLKQSNTRVLYKVYLPVSITRDERTNIKVEIEDDNTVKLYVVYDKLRGELTTAIPWYNTDEEMLLDYELNHKYVRE